MFDYSADIIAAFEARDLQEREAKLEIENSAPSPRQNNSDNPRAVVSEKPN